MLNVYMESILYSISTGVSQCVLLNSIPRRRLNIYEEIYKIFLTEVYAKNACFGESKII